MTDATLREELAALRRDVDAMRAARPPISGDDTSGTWSASSSTPFARDTKAEDDAVLSPKTAKRLERATEEVELQASMWDATVFAFTPVSGPLGSLFFLLLSVANILMQVSFVAVIGYGMLEPAVSRDDLHDVRLWRRDTAHTIQYYDQSRDRSLARRVCQQDFGLEVSGVQASLYAALEGYLGGINSKKSGVGPYLCMLALAMWGMVLFKDAKQAFDTIGALLAIPRGETEIRISKDRTVIINQLSKRRVCAAVGMQLLRLVVAGGLAYVGSVYLGRTIDPGDLILNAVALEFILSVDDYLFAVFAPKRFRALIRHAKPLTSPPMFPSAKGLNAGAVVSLGALLAALLSLYFGLVLPQSRLLRNAQYAMCAGDIDFVYGVDAVGGPHWAKTGRGKSRSGRLEQHNFPDGESRKHVRDKDPLVVYDLDGHKRLSYVERMVDTVLQQFGRDHFQDGCNASVCNDYWIGPEYPEPAFNMPTCCIPAKTLLDDVRLVFDATRAPIEQVVREVNPSSFDVLDVPSSGNGILAVSLSALVPSKPCGGCGLRKPLCNATTRTCGVAYCRNFTQYCNDATELGRRSRALCGDTCGCTNPRSPLALSLPDEGCGSATNSGLARLNLDELPCEDVAPNDIYFAVFLDNVDKAALGQPLDERDRLVTQTSHLRAHGCAYLRDPTLWDNLTTIDAWLADANKSTSLRPPYFVGANPCVREGARTKPLSIWCPRACGCHRGDQDCPTSCPQRDATTEACPDYMQDIYPGFNGWCALLPEAKTFDAGVVVN